MGLKRGLWRSTGIGRTIDTVKNIVDEGSISGGVKRMIKEDLTEDNPLGKMIYDSGRYDGKKEGYEEASAEYEHKLIEQADLFLKQTRVFEEERDEYEKLLDEKNTLNDTYLRMLAEYDNFRKRVQKEKEGLYADGMAEAVEKLLPVLDNLERAASAEATDVQSVLDGVKKVLSQADEIFAKLGVSEIPAKGEKFDPELHNAVMHEENEDFDENTVSDVFLKGYKLGDKVIRHSVVKVMN